MPVAARITRKGELLLAGELSERAPAITPGLTAFLPFDNTLQRYVPQKIRYIRDWANGSTANTSNHWVEIAAYNADGTNVALGATSSGTSTPVRVTDGDVATANWAGGSAPGLGAATVDLGAVLPVSKITVWHYYGDGRTYHNTKTEVSVDGVTWYVLFDSAVEGEYPESASGRSHTLGLGPTCGPIASDGATTTDSGLSVTQSLTSLTYDPALIDLNNGTVSVWFTPDAAFFGGTTSWNRLVGHASTTNKNEIQVMRSATSSQLCFNISNNAGTPVNSNWSDLLHPTVLAAGVTYHVVARWDSASQTYAIFINGVKEEKAWNTSVYLPTVLGTLAVGYHPTVVTRRAFGTLANLAIFNRALSDAEIATLYRTGSRDTPTVTPSGDMRVSRIVERAPTAGTPQEALLVAQSSRNIVDWQMAPGGWNAYGATTGGVAATKDFFGTTIPVRDVSNPNASGGISIGSAPFAIDQNKAYEFSCWYFVQTKTAGNIYLGTNGYDAASANVGVLNEAGTANTNPYWHTPAASATGSNGFPRGRWFQMRGYLVPAHWTAADMAPFKNGWETSDVWTANVVYRFTPSMVRTQIRMLNYYDLGAANEVYFALPYVGLLQPMRRTASGLYTYSLEEGQSMTPFQDSALTQAFYPGEATPSTVTRTTVATQHSQ